MLDIKNITPLLEVKHIAKKYGNIYALKDVNLLLNPGEIHGLIGGNGAGKSTLLHIMSGAKLADSGEILINGVPQHFANPKDAMDKSIAIVYQELSLLPHLSVAENIARGNSRCIKKGLYDANAAYVEAFRILTQLGGAARHIDPSSLVYTLSANQKQIVEIARAVGLGARIILLDEPTSSLNQEETNNLFDMMRRLSQEGLGFLFVTHRMAEIRMICSCVSVIRDGYSVVEHQNINDITDEALVAAMLGRKLDTEGFKKSHFDPNTANTILTINYDKKPDMPISIREGEVVGVAGLTSSGRSALLRTIWGVEPSPRISFEFEGKPFKSRGPKEAIKAGIAYITEDRKVSGLYLDQRLVESLMSAKRVYDFSHLISKEENLLVSKLIKLVNIKVPSYDSYPSELSGGNQQKLLVARWMMQKPKLFLLDEPTRGVDIATKFDIYEMIHRLAQMGTACIVVSSEASELVRLSHRVIILKDGIPDEVVEESDISEDKILHSITASIKGV